MPILVKNITSVPVRKGGKWQVQTIRKGIQKDHEVCGWRGRRFVRLMLVKDVEPYLDEKLSLESKRGEISEGEFLVENSKLIKHAAQIREKYEKHTELIDSFSEFSLYSVRKKVQQVYLLTFAAVACLGYHLSNSGQTPDNLDYATFVSRAVGGSLILGVFKDIFIDVPSKADTFSKRVATAGAGLAALGSFYALTGVELLSDFAGYTIIGALMAAYTHYISKIVPSLPGWNPKSKALLREIGLSGRSEN